MKNKILVGSIIAVAILIGVSFTSAINASVVKDNLVEFDVEFCGLNKKHTVKLTQEQAKEVDLLFDDVKQQLENAKSREEAINIVNEAIIQLDKYGLLDDNSIEKIQKLSLLFSPNIIDDSKERLGIQDRDSFCIVAGQTNMTHFIPTIGLVPMIPLIIALSLPSLIIAIPIFSLLILFNILLFRVENPFLNHLVEQICLFLFYLNDIFMYGIPLGIAVLIFILWRLFPPKIINYITFGHYKVEPEIELFPSYGWVKTYGILDSKSWEGSFYGHIYNVRLPMYRGIGIGITGFMGIRMVNGSTTSFLGSAINVNIDYSPPF